MTSVNTQWMDITRTLLTLVVVWEYIVRSNPSNSDRSLSVSNFVYSCLEVLFCFAAFLEYNTI